MMFVVSQILLACSMFSKGEDIGTEHTIYSETLNEERDYRIVLPPNYSSEHSYPVIYLLDGKILLPMVSAITDIFSYKEEIPQTIVVSISNTNRERDMTPTHSNNGLDGAYIDMFLNNSGGADNFLKFITDELIPHIESEYSTNNQRSLAGHSNSGLFTLYAFLQKSDFFQSYVATDPSLVWDDEVMLKLLKQKMTTPSSAAIKIYIAAANNQNSSYINHNRFRQAQNNFAKSLSDWNNDQLVVKMEYFEEEDHMTSAFPALKHGFEFVLKD